MKRAAIIFAALLLAAPSYAEEETDKLTSLFRNACVDAMPFVSAIISSAEKAGLKELYTGESRLDKGEVLENARGWEIEPGYVLEVGSGVKKETPVLSCAVQSDLIPAITVLESLKSTITSEGLEEDNGEQKMRIWRVAPPEKDPSGNPTIFKSPMMIIMLYSETDKSVVLRARIQTN